MSTLPGRHPVSAPLHIMQHANMFCLCQDSEYVVAVRNYITEDRSLLSFHKGDIIRVQHMDGLEAGETHKQGHRAPTSKISVDLLLASVKHVVSVSVSLSFTSCLSPRVCVFAPVHVHMCMCSGKYYGCIVKKRVMLLEELKRDTPEFGECDMVLQPVGICCVCLCVFVFVGWFGSAVLSN